MKWQGIGVLCLVVTLYSGGAAAAGISNWCTGGHESLHGKISSLKWDHCFGETREQDSFPGKLISYGSSRVHDYLKGDLFHWKDGRSDKGEGGHHGDWKISWSHHWWQSHDWCPPEDDNGDVSVHGPGTLGLFALVLAGLAVSVRGRLRR